MPKARAIKKLLVANRGEIALRIIRSARLLGIKTVAVFSEADAGSTHAAAADEARLIGPAEASASYLNIEAIIAAAKAVRADAIHPGYGFLSERAEFARAVADAGIVFVGPPAGAMRALGDKVAARKLAVEVGVPVVPGTEAADLDAVRDFAAGAGFPILVKASAGGGGRGMRFVTSETDLTAALEAASREARAAFGDGRIFVEKFLARPRHIEVQILADNHGDIVALGERDCSIQRRHQKIIEESPAPGLSEATRAGMIKAAIRLARAARYRNAGTIEFLVEGDSFCFLEANTRLQVEHPITEMRFGCDLVAEQIRIAAGEKVSELAAPRGAAIECRVYAEDAEHDFRPASGRVMCLNLPAGPGIRVDTHLTPGADITTHYDGLLAKVIAFGETRQAAQRRMLVALDEFALIGVTHTAGFLRDVIASDPFARAKLSIRFLDEFFPRWHPAQELFDEALVAAALVAEGALGVNHARESSALASMAGGDARPTEACSRSPWDELKGFDLWSRR
jgi:3-methylcrotonyl-CoA carboxylase alpha subunit